MAIAESSLAGLEFTGMGFVSTDEKTARIAVSGILNQAAYRQIHKAFASFKDRPHVIFEINSPGGFTSGLFDTCDLIQEARKHQRVSAVVENQATSAGYALAASCTDLYIGRSATVGSCGVIAMHCDQSALDARVGLKYTAISSGSRKMDLNPHFPLNPQAYNSLKREIDAEATVLHEIVAQGRGMNPDQIRQQEAVTFHGQDAIKAGMADEIIRFPFTGTLPGNNGRTGPAPKTALQQIKEGLGKLSGEAQVKAAMYLANQDNTTETWRLIKEAGGIKLIRAVAVEREKGGQHPKPSRSNRHMSSNPRFQQKIKSAALHLSRPKTRLQDLSAQEQIDESALMLAENDSSETRRRIIAAGGMSLIYQAQAQMAN